MEGTLTQSQYNPAPSAGLTQMEEDIAKVAPGTKTTSLIAASYFAADMFIKSVKTAAKKGKDNITPEAVQRVAADQTWQIKGFAGPTIYPDSTVVSTKSCNAVLEDADGTAWTIVDPYTCSSKVHTSKK
jgi:hypothetical protein